MQDEMEQIDSQQESEENKAPVEEVTKEQAKQGVFVPTRS